MAEKKVVAKGKAYKGSKQNGGRKIVVVHYKDSSGKWRTTSKNAARHEYEKRNGKMLEKKTNVVLERRKRNDSTTTSDSR